MKLERAVVLCAFLLYQAAAASDLHLWYEAPAKDPMTEALPIGNGRLGALIFGGMERERLVINENSLWTGDENPSGNYDTMGAYQVLGDVFIDLPGHSKCQNYRRNLNVAEALAHVTYELDGVTYRREYFCSHPAGILVGRIAASQPGRLSGRIQMQDTHGAQTVCSTNGILIRGHLNNGLEYAWQLLLLPEGGTCEAKDHGLNFVNCDRLSILIAAATNYRMDYSAGYRGGDPQERISSQLGAAARLNYNALRTEHVEDFQTLFRRVSLNLGKSSERNRALSTDRRKLAAFNETDPELEELLFQYGRYLLISCSRPGGLPANLQGLWNDSNDPPWHSDYHANINVQMNYWPAEVANLSECHLPFLELVQSQIPAWRKTTAAAQDLKCPSGELTRRGFAIRTSHNIMGGMGWKWDKTANAWYCLHFWEHFAFTHDTNFLRSAAYPILKETCQYWADHLKRLPDGKLVVPNAWSPEHGPDEDGVSYSQEIIWDLFNNYVQAGAILETDAADCERFRDMRDHLVQPGVGSWGQLLEWMTEKTGTNVVAGSPELDTPKDHHRHTSHLFAVYPGSQFTTAENRARAAAAKVSLDARGTAPDSDVREWSLAWRCALYARLHDGASAHRMLQQLFSKRNTCVNLFGLHPPMQMDGNFGITAGICEMLLQSQNGEIELLPALPAEWPSGSFKGLRARGGFEVDVSWRDRKLSEATVRSTLGGQCRVHYGMRSTDLMLGRGESKKLGPEVWEK